MLSLPPPPPKQTKSPPPNQIILSKQPLKKPTPLPDQPAIRKSKKPSLLQPPRRTNPIIWCGAILCIFFSLLLILSGIATLIIFLVIKPRHPLFDTTNAILSSVYLDSPEYFNGDFTFLANFSNPNKKIDVRFEHLEIELYFLDRLIAKQALESFTQRRQEVRLESVHMVSSEVYMPLNLSTELQKQVQSNKVRYNLRGIFRVRATLGLFHFSYWLYGRCQVDMSGPPNGVLVARSCRTKR